MDLLNQSGLTRKALGEILGVHPGTVSRWGDKLPRYAVAYLELYIKVKELTNGNTKSG